MKPAWFDRLNPAFENAPRCLESLAWPELQQTFDDVLLLPVGATEQHGPHLPINTDTIIAEATCALASSLTAAPILPALRYTVSLGHTEKWPGTFAVFHETLMQTVRSVAAWATASGWKRLILVNSHCGNDAALRCAVDRIRFDYAGSFLVAARNTWQLSPEIERDFTRDALDWHANEAETSLVQFIAPEDVHLDRLHAADDEDRTARCVFPHLVANTSTNGVTGTPSQATPARGAALLARMGEALAALIERARADEPPLPWIRTTVAFSH